MALTITGVRELLEAHATHRTAHGAHLQVLRDLLAGVEPEPTAAPSTLQEPLKERELAVLRFLSTNLTAAEIDDVLITEATRRLLLGRLAVVSRGTVPLRGKAEPQEVFSPLALVEDGLADPVRR